MIHRTGHVNEHFSQECPNLSIVRKMKMLQTILLEIEK